MEHLTPEGAARLRAVRRRFVEKPEQYGFAWMSECGTHGCVGGWLCSDAGKLLHFSTQAMKILGFQPLRITADIPVFGHLFFGHKTAEQAIVRIDEFLWHFGYPPEEIEAPVGEAVAV